MFSFERYVCAKSCYNAAMKTLLAITCAAILMIIGEHFWSAQQDDKFEKALAEITAREAAVNSEALPPTM